MQDDVGLPIKDVTCSGPAVDAHEGRKEGTASTDTPEMVMAFCVNTLNEVLTNLLQSLPDPKLSRDLRLRQQDLQRLHRVSDLLQSRWLGD
jgi:hypothetical protein